MDFRSLLMALVVSSSMLGVACVGADESAPAGDESASAMLDEQTAEASDALVTGNVKPVPLDVEIPLSNSTNVKAGATVLKTKAEYVKFFGAQPPSSVDFAKHAVVHFAAGVQPTGGYGAEITSVNHIAANGTLAIAVTLTSPGPGCIVTQAFTHPQSTVRINKPKGNPLPVVAKTSQVTDCSSSIGPTIKGNVNAQPLDAGLGPFDSNAKAGLTVLNTIEEYVAFFGTKPTVKIDFAKQSVVYYSAGMSSTGGYKAEITAINHIAPNGTLAVAVTLTSPGVTCPVPMVITLPQAAAIIDKPKGNPLPNLALTNVTKECKLF